MSKGLHIILSQSLRFLNLFHKLRTDRQHKHLVGQNVGHIAQIQIQIRRLLLTELIHKHTDSLMELLLIARKCKIRVCNAIPEMGVHFHRTLVIRSGHHAVRAQIAQHKTLSVLNMYILGIIPLTPSFQ